MSGEFKGFIAFFAIEVVVIKVRKTLIAVRAVGVLRHFGVSPYSYTKELTVLFSFGIVFGRFGGGLISCGTPLRPSLFRRIIII